VKISALLDMTRIYALVAAQLCGAGKLTTETQRHRES